MDLGGLDAVLPAEGVDLIGSVIASDRRRAGRGEYNPDRQVDYDNMTSPMTDRQADLSDDLPADMPASLSYDVPASLSADTQVPLSDDHNVRTATTTQANEPASTPAQAIQQPKKKAPIAKPDSGRHPSQTRELPARIDRAKEMANSRTMTVTLRLPQELNDWLDEYVHESWRDRLKKQQLVIEALCMLVARRGRAGENVIPTELLGETQEL